MIPGFATRTANSLQLLASGTAELLTGSPPAPLAPELIVTPTRGVQRWLSLELARRHGICANTRFLLPNAFLDELFGRVFPGVPTESPFAPEVLTWRLAGALPRLRGEPGFEQIDAYLGNDAEPLKLIQLADRVARTYDKYLLFRPDMISAWDEGKDPQWQAQLWREVSKANPGQHRAALARRFTDLMTDTKTPVAGLPERVTVFGISALPRFHLEVLKSLSARCAVNVFAVSPCRGDRVNAGDGRVRNPLLGSLGDAGREFHQIVHQLGLQGQAEWAEPSTETLLGQIQADILNCAEVSGERQIAAGDESMQVHSCHSRQREVEVLHDYLLRCFETDPRLTPADVVVMTPDLEGYAPYIEAVFGAAHTRESRIPHSLAFSQSEGDRRTVDAFFETIDLCGSRMGAAAVFNVLSTDAVARKFGLHGDDREKIRSWIDKAGIRWGKDEESRGELDLPAFGENTWRFGLDRLVLGYALPGGGKQTFAGVLPFDDVEGTDAGSLDRFLGFTGALFETVAGLDEERTLVEWAESLRGLLDRLFEVDDQEDQDIRRLYQFLERLGQAQELTGYDAPVPRQVVRWYLARQMEDRAPGAGLVNGTVLFTDMAQMRSVPYRVICVLGLDGDAFPRQDRPPGFDLAAQDPRPGDRSRRTEDRYLFLEALMAARDRLYLSCVGQSIVDNSAVPPSVVISELLDYVDRGFAAGDGGARQRLVVRHKLQPFHAEYFTGGGPLYSYSEEQCRAATTAVGKRKARGGFMPQQLSPPEDEYRTISLATLCHFFANPAAFLMRRRLNLQLLERAAALDETELFEVTGLERYALETEVVDALLSGADVTPLRQAVAGGGLLPLGNVGQYHLDKLVADGLGFASRVKPYLQKPHTESVPVDIAVGDFRITGEIDRIYGDHVVHYRAGRIRAKDRITSWLHQLVLDAMARNDLPKQVVTAGLGEEDREWTAFTYRPQAEPAKLLAVWLDTYWRGLHTPLHFFPSSSLEFAVRMQRTGGDLQKALGYARGKWEGSSDRRGEREDPYFELCFRGTDPLTEEFTRLSQELLRPLLGAEAKE